ncbi:MAG: hypothetical protein U0W24_04275 [Bacteroidales bacterium]
MTNKILIDKMLKSPLEFTSSDFNELIGFYKNADGSYNTNGGFKDLRECVRRIYDLNELQLRETSNANNGLLGKLNRRSSHLRQKTYFKKVENQKPGKKYTRIYAEGDSWFLFPTFVKDVIDWLIKEDNYLIFSEAYGGDWITNIIYEGQYIESLSVHSPDVFLISGGGNDLVGNSRMAIMVSNLGNQTPKYNQNNPLPDDALTGEEKELIMLAQKYITKDFYSFILVMKAQYTLLFNQLYWGNSKHKHMISITQGYAYPYPKKGINFSLRYPFQPLVNWFLQTGQWLFRPLMIKKILDPVLQRAIVMTFIYEFNNMFIEIASVFPNVYHIDCRRIPQNQSDWYDELHLKSHVFKRVAELYIKVIKNENNNLPKIIF